MPACCTCKTSPASFRWAAPSSAPAGRSRTRCRCPIGETVDLTPRAVETYNRLGLDCLVCLGGNGTHKVAYSLIKQGLNVIGLPKTIDNDLAETDITFGYDSAVTHGGPGHRRLYSTAEAHLRVMVIELMGHNAGWLTLSAGLAGGADIILIPEIPYDIESICQHLTERRRRGKWFSIVAVAEGAQPQADQANGRTTPKDKNKKKDKKKKKKEAEAIDDLTRRPGQHRAVAKAISRRLDMETRVTVLGHLQRGGIPTPFDRILATRFGTYAAEMLAEGIYNHMVCLKGSEVDSVPLEEGRREQPSWCRSIIPS